MTRDKYIDVWRFIAIALVLACHLAAYSHPFYREAAPGLVWRIRNLGTVGVQIFFCISGYVICRGMLSETLKFGDVSMRHFYLRRTFRILPPLLIYMFGVLVLDCFGILKVVPHQFYQSVLFLCNFKAVGDCGWPLGHTWSLAYEEQFYLLFPVLFASLAVTAHNFRIVFVVALVSLLIVTTGWLALLEFNTYLSHFLCMLAGCVCAIYRDTLDPRLQKLTKAAWLCFTIALPVIAMTVFPQQIQTMIIPLLLPVLICLSIFGTPSNANIFRPIFQNSFLSYLGRISYFIYLWQQIATVDYGFASPLLAILLVLIVILFAHFSYQYFELPLMRRVPRRDGQLVAQSNAELSSRGSAKNADAAAGTFQ